MQLKAVVLGCGSWLPPSPIQEENERTRPGNEVFGGGNFVGEKH